MNLKIHIFTDPRNLANLKQEKYKENHVCAYHSKTENQREKLETSRYLKICYIQETTIKMTTDFFKYNGSHLQNAEFYQLRILHSLKIFFKMELFSDKRT